MNIRHIIRDSFARAILLAGLVVAALILTPLAHGQTDIFKGNNTTDLSSNLSWTLTTGGAGGNPATVNANDLGIIDSTVNAANAAALTFSSNLTLGGLQVKNPGGAVTINATTPLTLNLGNSAVLGNPTYFSSLPYASLDLSNSSVNLTLGSNITTILATGQNWYVGNATSHPTLTVNGPLNMGVSQLYLVGTGNYNIAGNISGTAGYLIVDSTGTTTLSGTNTNAGGVWLANGTLVLTNNSSLGTGTFQINSQYLTGTTYLNTGASNISISTGNNIQLDGNLNFLGAANLSLGTGAMILGANETMNITANTLTIAGTIVDGGTTANSTGRGLTKIGAGSLQLAGANTFTGNLNLQVGTLSLTNNLALQDAILNYTGGTLTFTAGSQLSLGGLAGTQNIALGTGNLTINTVYGHNATYSGNLTGGNTTSTVTIGGAAIQAFSGFSNYTGNTTLNSGTLAINGGGNATAGPIGASTSKLIITGGSLDNTSGANVTLLTNNAQQWNGNFTFAGTGNLNLGTGAVAMNASRTVTVSANTLTVGGIISGSGDSLTKAGTYGTLVLTGANTYTGGTIVNAGTLVLTGANNFGTGTFTINAGGTLSLNGTDTITGNTTLNGGGQLNFNNNGAISGGSLIINGGTLDNTSAGTVASTSNNAQQWNGDFTFAGTNSLNLGTGAVAMNASRNLTVNNSTLTVGGVISGTGFSLTQSGNGTLVLNGANTYTGGTIINSGTVVLSGNDHSATGNVTVNSGGQLDFNNVQSLGTGATLILNDGSSLDNTSGGTITNANNNAAQLNGGINYAGSNALNYGTGGVTLLSNSTLNVEASTLTLGGVVSGGFGLTKNGTGTLVLSGTNSYSGYTDINGGTLSVGVLANGGSNSGIGSSSNAATNLVIANNGTLQYTGGTVSTDRLFTIGNFTATIDASGSGNLTFSNTGAINFNPTGTSNGTVGQPANFVDASVSDTLILTGSNTGRNTMDPSIGNNPGSTYATNITKTGAGEWVLAGNNTYSGLTTVSAGTLALAGQSANATYSALGQSTLVMAGGNLDNTSGANLTIGTNNAEQWNNSFTFVGTGNLNMGTGNITLGNSSGVTLTTTASTLTLGGVIGDNGLGYNLTKAGAGTLVLNGNNTFSGNMNVTAGTLVVTNNISLQNAILNQTGGTVTFSTANATLGGLAGNQNIAAKALTLDTASSTNVTYSGALTGTASLIMNGAGEETFNGSNTNTGGMTVNGGTLILSGSNTFNAGTLVVNAGGTLTLNGTNTITGCTTVNNGGTLDYNNAGAISGGTLVMNAGSSLDNTSAGTVTSTTNVKQSWNGNFTYVGTQSLNIGTGNVALGNTDVITINANTLTVGGNISGAFGLTLNGSGTLDLDPNATLVNKYSGATTINGGTLIVDFSRTAATTANVIINTSALVLGGGTLEMLGFGASSTNKQTFASTTINAGASTMNLTDNGGTSFTGNLRAITRNTGGTLNIAGTIGTTGNILITTGGTVTNNVLTSGGIAYLTVNGTAWGNLSGTDIIAMAAAQYVAATNTTTWSTAADNLNVTASHTLTSTEGNINSLEFQGTTASTVTLMAGTLTIDTGGLLVASNVTANDVITGGNITGANVTKSELVVFQNGSGNFTIASNIINQGSNSTVLTKAGTGELVINGTNTYSGGTYLNQGTLGLGSNSSLGTGALIINGGTLDVTSGAAMNLTNNNALTLNNSFTFKGSQNLNLGTGTDTVNSKITLTMSNATSTLTIGGPISGAGGFTLAANSGTLVLSGANTYTGGTTVNGGTLTVTGNNSGTGAAFTVNTGTLNLNGSNTITGNTTLNGGTLNLNAGGNATASSLGTGTLIINSGTLDNTSGANVTIGTNNAVDLNGNFTFAGSGNLNLGTGAVALGQNENITVAANSLTLGGVISGGYGLIKSGAGDLVLSGASTYTGGTVINAGTLEANNNNALGAGGVYNTVTVNNGATLQLDQGFDSTDTGSSLSALLSLNGTGVGGQGALLASGSGTAEWAGNISLAGNATISAGTTAGSVLNLGNSSAYSYEPGFSNISLGANTLTFTGGQNTNITVDFAPITGSGGIVVNMTSNATNSANNGVVDYNMWGNSYTGTTTVANGTLIIDTQVNGVPLTTSNGNLTAINGPLVIGDGINAANTSIVQIGNGDTPTYALATTTNVTINSDGQLFLSHGSSQAITNLTMNNGGYINTYDSSGIGYNAQLQLLGTTTINGNGTSTAVIDGNLVMSNSVGNATNVFNVNGGNAISDLTVNALISGGSLLKTGTGTMTLTNSNNSYSGATEIVSGTLAITVGSSSSDSVTATSPLGESNGNTSANGTMVDNGGQLQLQNNITINGEALTINGNGTNNNGALNNASGNNTWNGTITVGAQNATINTSGGNLTLAGNITSAGSTPTLNLAGNNTTTTISGAVNGAVSLNLTSGPGGANNTVQMTGTLGNSYTGNTTINANTTLELNRTAGLNSVINGGTITINQGGTLLSDTSEQINIGANMNLNGGTWTTNGSNGATFAESLGTLTLSMSSNIDLGANSNTITFLASSGDTWAPGASLYINGWNGAFSTDITANGQGNNGGGGQDQITFSSQTGLGGNSYIGQLGDIVFVNPEWNGVQYTGDYNAVILADGEVVPFLPAPEPGTVGFGAGLATLALVREWRRRKAQAKIV